MDNKQLLARYKTLLSTATQNKAALDRAKGVRDSLLKTAKDKVGVNSLVELKELLTKIQGQAEEKYKELDNKLTALEKESGDLNINDLQDLGLGNV